MPNGKKPTPKTQKEISIGLQEPFDKEIGNPNLLTTENRANQLTFRNDSVKPFSIGFEDIDNAILFYFKNIIKPFVIQNGERIEVPVIYGSPEKWKSYQKDGYYRDDNGKIMLPLIMFKKNNIEKVRSIGNKLDSNNPNNFAITEKKFNQNNAYSNFNLLNNVVPKKTYYATVIPDYINIIYDCVIQTYYASQLNKLIEAIEYASDSYWGDPERFKFRAQIDNFSTSNELENNKERSVKCTFNIKLYGYIVPDTIQKDLSSIKKFNNKTKTVIVTEIDK